MILQTPVQSSALSKKSTAQKRVIVTSGQSGSQAEHIMFIRLEKASTLLRCIIRRAAIKVALGSCEKIVWELEGYNNKKLCVSEVIKRNNLCF